MEPKETAKQVGWLLVGNVGLVLGIFLCMTLLGIPAGVFVIIASGKMFWRAAKIIVAGPPAPRSMTPIP
jgi:hypothetical protein